jgi:hypothetical protein
MGILFLTCAKWNVSKVLTAVVALHVLLQISISVFGDSSRVSACSCENSLPKIGNVGYL